MLSRSLLCLSSTAIGLLFFSTPAIANSVTFDRKLTAPDGLSGDYFGWSVALDGNLALVGSYLDDESGHHSGSAYLFDTTTGNLLHKLTAPDGSVGDTFGYSLALDGDLALIGSSHDDDNNIDSGSAYLFDTTTGNFLHKLTAPDSSFNNVFGYSVALDGDLALIGAVGDGSYGISNGSAYLFDTTTGNFLHKLTVSDSSPDRGFGRSVALDGNLALVGAYGGGSVYFFDTTTGNILHKLTAPDSLFNNAFGYSLTLDGDLALISAYGDDDNGFYSGSAYLFDTTTGNFLHKLTAPDGSSGDRFGQSVALDGDLALISASFDNDNGTNSGSAYLFDTTTGNFLHKLTASDGSSFDIFGESVALDGGIALIGAYLDDDKGPNSGSAYLFKTAEGLQTRSVPEPTFILGLSVICILVASGVRKKKVRQNPSHIDR